MDTLHLFDEPITERSGLEEGVTTMGSPAVAQLHHLRALNAALEPARAAYAAAAVEQLRSLPVSVRRQVFPQVLGEHPMLAQEPAVQELADELGITLASVTETATSAAYARMEAVLPVLADGLAELERERAAVSAELELEPTRQRTLPRTASDVLAWILDERVPPKARAEELDRALRALVAHAAGLRDAARKGAQALVAATDPEVVGARTRTPSWWPRPFRDAVVLAALRAVHGLGDDGRSHLDEVHRARFGAAYAARVNERP